VPLRGFAADLRTLPNTVFYGASEEDVVSEYANELGAGGYLSLFFREAIDGTLISTATAFY